MPFFYEDVAGGKHGILVDFWQLWSKRTGIPVTFELQPPDEAIKRIQENRADILAGVSFTNQRAAKLHFSSPFYELSCAIYHRVGTPPPKGMEDLTDRRVGVADASLLDFVVNQAPGANAKLFPDPGEMVAAALAGEIDAFILENRTAMAYLARDDGFRRFARSAPVTIRYLHAGVKKGRYDLLATVNQGLGSISQEDMAAIVRRWAGDIRPKGENRRPESVIIVYSQGSAPFHFTDESGLPAGFFIDLWRLWSQKTGVEVVFKGRQWGETLDMMRRGEADIHAGLFFSPERDLFLDFGPGLYETETHFFHHKSIFGLNRLEDLRGFEIGIIKGDYAQDFLKAHLPGSTPAVFASNEALFDAVENGDIRVFIKDTPIALYHLSQRNLLSQFRYPARRPLYANWFRAAVRKGDKDMLALVEEGLNAIGQAERDIIEHKWMGTGTPEDPQTLTVAVPKGQLPFSGLDPEARPVGLLIDIWRLWSEKAGRPVEFRVFEQADALKAVITQEADIHGGLYASRDRMTRIDFSQAFYRIPVHLFYSGQDGRPKPSGDLTGLKVGALSGSYAAAYLKTQFPRAEVISFTDDEALLEAILKGRIDAFAGDKPVAVALLERSGARGQILQKDPPLLIKKIRAGVLQGRRDLLTLIDEGFDAISHGELVVIEKRWIANPELRQLDSAHPDIRLTTAEAQWIADHGEIRLGVDPNWPPFDYLGPDGTHMGMASDYVQRIAERLGLLIRVVPKDTWADVMQAVKSREIDMVACMTPTPGRRGLFAFTRPYLSFPWVIVTRIRYPLLSGLDDLHGHSVAVVRDYTVHQLLADDHPQVKLEITDSPLQGLNLVSLGKADAYVGNLAVASHLIALHNIANLKVSASADIGSDALCMGVREDWPQLVSVLNKGLATITPAEKDQIRQKWFAVRFEHGIDTTRLRQLLLRFAVVAAIVVALMLYWNRRLQKEINVRKNTELENRKLIQAAEQSPSCVIITDREGVIEYVNPRFCQLTGYSMAEALGQSPRILKSGQMPAAFYQALWQTILNGRTWRGDLINRKKSGELFWVSASISPIQDPSGRITHFIGVNEDISARKLAEENLMAAKQEAEAANRAKSDFLARMSHEIRTPMNAIIGMGHLIHHTPLSDRQADYVQKIQNAALSLLDIINDILDFSKIEAGRLTLEAVPFDLDKVLEHLSNLVSLKAEEKGLELVFKIDPDVPRRVVGDPLRLGQILTNLVNNAIKFTPKGDIIVSIEIERESPGAIRLRFGVRDTGVGIAAEDQTKLFQPFAQADGSTTRKFGGSGLGLVICKRLVNMMGGQIRLESEKNQGSLFTFTARFGLDLNQSQPVSIPSTDLRGLKALVVDDNRHAREMLKKTLESFSFEVEAAASGPEALQLLQSTAGRQTFDLVLMDYQMPEMNGLEAARAIKTDLALGNVPQILMVTAYGKEEMNGNTGQGQDIGLEGILSKPVSRSGLFDAIMRIFHQTGTSPGRVPPPTDDKAGIPKTIIGAKILLVEDNEVNQQVARELLEHMGMIVATADNGIQGVEAVSTGSYDLVLMDIEMPEMDGYAAAREIRKSGIGNQELGNRNQELGKDDNSPIASSQPPIPNSQFPVPIPIIAMTAHAMTGDRDKCLDAGMNDYIAKPIDPEILTACLIKWITPGEREVPPEIEARMQQPAAPQAPVPDIDGLDTRAGLVRIGGDLSAYYGILFKFSQNHPDTAHKIADSLSWGDIQQAGRLVHTLKSVAGNIGAREVYRLALAFEKALKAGDMDQTGAVLTDLGRALDRVMAGIKTLERRTEPRAPLPPARDEQDPQTLAALVKRLAELLRQDDMAADTCLQELKAAMDTRRFSAEFDDIAAHMRRYDFESAAKVLSSVAQGLGIEL